MTAARTSDDYYDPRIDARVFKLLPGACRVGAGGGVIATLLGSCVAACLYDPEAGIGGMNHFLLPDAGPADRTEALLSSGARYGVFAMESLINELLAAGARREQLRVKLFGGARVLPRLSDVGRRNIDFARNFVSVEGLTLVGEDLGGEQPRKLIMYPESGRVLVRRLPQVESRTIAAADTHYLRRMDTPVEGSVELF